MSMSNASRVGFRRAVPFNLGIWSGFTLVTLSSAAFCSLLSSVLPAIELPMKIVGAAYMVFLAYKTFRSKPAEEGASVNNSFWSGLLLQFVNPKIIIYAIVSMEAYILPHFFGQTTVLALFALLLSTVGFLCSLCWAAFGSAFRTLFTRHARVTNAIMALALVYCAGALFL
ncbi:MAG: LysE family transporter [Clostridiales bacterium]|nr:LysE family transporter [Clostridiales bacterium]